MSVQEEEPKYGTPEWWKLHSIFGTNMTDPPEVVIGQLRDKLSNIRGQLSDLSKAYPRFAEDLASAEGLLTCGLVHLYYAANPHAEDTARASGFRYGLEEARDLAQRMKRTPSLDDATAEDLAFNSGVRAVLEAIEKRHAEETKAAGGI